MQTLTDIQIEHLLRAQTVGHLGLIKGKLPHVVPIGYVFDGSDIYAHSKEGEKISLMRKKPLVCFQVESIDSLDKWRSVILYGRYEELTDARDVDYAMKLVADRFDPLLSNDVARRPENENDPPLQILKSQRAIYFRIVIKDRFGRYQK